MQIIINNAILNIREAKTFFSRFCGLMFRKKLPANTGLLIAPCNSIHMCWMRFSIDAVYVDKEFKVLKTVKQLRPWVGLSCCWKAYGVIELTENTVENLGIHAGDILQVKY